MKEICTLLVKLHIIFSRMQRVNQHARPFIIPRSQPAVRATALACLVLRRSYVSNSASPAADGGLKVILQPPYRQRTSLAAAVPPMHRIAHRKSHSEGTFNALAPCLRGTFNVRLPCHRPRVRTSVCMAAPQWHGAGALKAPLTCVARTDISSLPRVYGELINSIHEKFIFSLIKHGGNTWHGTPGEIFFWKKYIWISPLNFFDKFAWASKIVLPENTIHIATIKTYYIQGRCVM